MNKRRAILAAAICIPVAMQAWAAEQHTVQGILLQVNRAKGSITVSCDAIPGYMEAMVMPFAGRAPAVLKILEPGATVRFTMVERGHEEYAEQLQAIKVTNYEAEPTESGRLTFLHRALDPAAVAKQIAVGQQVQDFTLSDQAQHATHFTQFRGKVVALTFAYSRCSNPNYCFRLSNNLSRLSQRFRDRIGRDLVLVTIVIDPDNVPLRNIGYGCKYCYVPAAIRMKREQFDAGANTRVVSRDHFILTDSRSAHELLESNPESSGIHRWPGFHANAGRRYAWPDSRQHPPRCRWGGWV
jgi:Cu/Ag efflux protein CusF